MKRFVLLLVGLVVVFVRPAAAQSGEPAFRAGIQFAGAVSSEFDSSDFGVGGHFSWYPTSLLGIDAEVSVYPSDFAGERAFSAARLEGLFGATVGPRLGNIRPFVKFRPGFVTFREAPEPFPCILIFPPPIACTLAAGRTIFALDLGGGIEWLASARTFFRVDAGDRIIRYPAPVFDSEGTIRDESFSSHDFRFAIGAGLRF